MYICIYVYIYIYIYIYIVSGVAPRTPRLRAYAYPFGTNCRTHYIKFLLALSLCWQEILISRAKQEDSACEVVSLPNRMQPQIGRNLQAHHLLVTNTFGKARSMDCRCVYSGSFARILLSRAGYRTSNGDDTGLSGFSCCAGSHLA